MFVLVVLSFRHNIAIGVEERRDSELSLERCLAEQWQTQKVFALVLLPFHHNIAIGVEERRDNEVTLERCSADLLGKVRRCND